MKIWLDPTHYFWINFNRKVAMYKRKQWNKNFVYSHVINGEK